MKIFLTGATGFLGSAIASALAHHDLLRERRDLRDPSSYRDDAEAADAIVHAAITSGPDRLEVDRRFVESVLVPRSSSVPRRSSDEGHGRGTPRNPEEPRGTPRVIYTSVMFVLGNIENRDESAPAHGFRAETERIVLDAGGAVIRPGMIWGGNAFLFNHPLYISEGANRWPLVHRDDVAELYRLVVESGARGVFHAVTEVMRAAEVFPGKGLPLDEARKMLGPFADALALDQDVRASRSREIGWKPSRRWSAAALPPL